MNYREKESNVYVMDIKERDVLSFLGNQFDYNKNPTPQERRAYYDAFIKYIDFALNYCQTELNGKTYTEKHIIPQVFKVEIKTEQAYKQYWRHSLFCAQLYLEFLKNYINQQFLERYKTIRLNLMCDIEYLFAQNERWNKNFKREILLTCGARHEVDTFDMLLVLNELKCIENIPDIKDITLRNIKPYQMFVIRQLLELLGKNVIGYDEILDENNRIIPKFTQISWEFLNKYSKKSKWEIITPISITYILLLNKWANSFVHSGYIYASYIIHYAVDVINKIMQSSIEPIDCYDGKKHQYFLLGDIRINNYNMLRQDFENYINSKTNSRKSIGKQQNKVCVKWKNIQDVGAYIVSL